jgi:hypothetical protein
MKTTSLLSVFLLCTVIFSNGQEWTKAFLTQEKAQMGAAVLGNKAYFAGGFNINLNILKEVEIYDVISKVWSYENLSAARNFPVGVSSGSKVFFAGGAIMPSNFFSTIDIFDTLTNQWTIEQLSVARFSLSAVSKGTKVLFAGGINLSLDKAYDVVDIYDTETHVWTINHLSVPRGAMGYAVVGDLAIFAGGYDNHLVTDRVDIYNFKTGTWSTATLSEARGFVSATTIGNKVLIAGGFNSFFTASRRVDIYDASTGVWSTAELSVARCSDNIAVTVGDKAFVVGGGTFDPTKGNFTSASNVIDVYDSGTNEWSAFNMENALVWHSVVAVGDYLLVAGGERPLSADTWYIVEYVSIYDPFVSIPSFPGYNTSLKVFPNPASNSITIEHPVTEQKTDGIVTIYGNAGQQILCQKTKGLKSEIDVTDLPPGVYFVKLVSNNKITSGKFVKMNY